MKSHHISLLPLIVGESGHHCILHLCSQFSHKISPKAGLLMPFTYSILLMIFRTLGGLSFVTVGLSVIICKIRTMISTYFWGLLTSMRCSNSCKDSFTSVQNISNTNKVLAVLISNTFDCYSVKPDTFFFNSLPLLKRMSFIS